SARRSTRIELSGGRESRFFTVGLQYAPLICFRHFSPPTSLFLTSCSVDHEVRAIEPIDMAAVVTDLVLVMQKPAT
ncbi:MAG TPA: hypothetical protein VIX18_01050, partial [Nitrospirota bacterium]